MAEYADDSALMEINKKYKAFGSRQVQVSNGVKDKEYYDSQQLKEIRVKFALSDTLDSATQVSVLFKADEDKLGLVFDKVQPAVKIKEFDEDVMQTFEQLREKAETILENEGWDMMEADADE